MSARVTLAVVATIAVILGVRAWNAHLVAQGDSQGAARVRSEWSIADGKRLKQEADARANAALARAKEERIARQAEQAKQQEAERIAREQAHREGALRSAVARADARNRSLLDTISELNARDAGDVSGTAEAAGTAALADAARTARDLLGQCSRRYTAVAADADRLANQVTGLLDFVRAVQQPAAGATVGATDGV
ncbi:DUF2514 domain-containing protein [Paracidovorax anthurii]|uniref:DUF2514 family protein n=1 Tax=Paracidovorax anthurii TaxID=78229 RepID=A0A328ZIM8_9BURK|nr:DUF2514 domain-containing protein [Paracidovorax anthurii]RAR86088.1 hypothetical protein AX018_100249 [Paracidovorax anthurii]